MRTRHPDCLPKSQRLELLKFARSGRPSKKPTVPVRGGQGFRQGGLGRPLSEPLPCTRPNRGGVQGSLRVRLQRRVSKLVTFNAPVICVFPALAATLDLGGSQEMLHMQASGDPGAVSCPDLQSRYFIALVRF